MTKFVENFKTKEDIIREYEAPADSLKGAKIFLAWYGYGSYEGDSLVIFEKDGKLFEVNAGHCSCMGLEGQWKPEETSWEALGIRKIYDGCEGSNETQKILDSLIKKNLKKVQ